MVVEVPGAAPDRDLVAGHLVEVERHRALAEGDVHDGAATPHGTDRDGQRLICSSGLEGGV